MCTPSNCRNTINLIMVAFSYAIIPMINYWPCKARTKVRHNVALWRKFQSIILGLVLKRALFSSISSLIHFSSVSQSCSTHWDPMDRSTPGLPVHHQLLEFIQTHVHECDAIHLSHPLSSLSLPIFNLSQHQGLLQWVSSSYQVAKVLEF